MRPTLRCLVIIPLIGLMLTGCSKPSPEEVFQEAFTLIQQGNITAARHRLEELLKDSPDSDLAPDIKLTIADCYNQEQKPDDAEAAFKEVADKYPKTLYAWKAHVRLGDMAAIEKKIDEAEGYYRAAIDDSTEDGAKLTAMNNLVRAYSEAEKNDQALQTLRDMLALAKDPEHKIRIGIQLTNNLLSQKKNDEAWTTLIGIYDPKFPSDNKEAFFSALIDATPATRKYPEAFQFFDSVIASATEDEARAQASFFNGLLASATAPYAVTGVATLKKTHEMLPKTIHGRWALVEAAQAVLAATAQFPNATPEAILLFDQAIKGYDDLINDMTIEWFEPLKAAWAWDQVGTIYEIKAQYSESLDDLKSASRTIAEIPKRFKALPQQVVRAQQWLERVAYKIHIAETSPEFFWQQTRLARAGKLPLPDDQAQQAADGAVVPATGEQPAQPQQPAPGAVPPAVEGQAAVPPQPAAPDQPAAPPAQPDAAQVKPASP